MDAMALRGADPSFDYINSVGLEVALRFGG
jgi:hypothetical protein